MAASKAWSRPPQKNQWDLKFNISWLRLRSRTSSTLVSRVIHSLVHAVSSSRAWRLLQWRAIYMLSIIEHLLTLLSSQRTYLKGQMLVTNSNTGAACFCSSIIQLVALKIRCFCQAFNHYRVGRLDRSRCWEWQSNKYQQSRFSSIQNCKDKPRVLK